MYGDVDVLLSAVSADLETVKGVLESNHPALLNQQNEGGDSVLIIACLQKKQDIAMWLLQQPHINIFLKNNAGKTAEDYAKGDKMLAVQNLLGEMRRQRNGEHEQLAFGRLRRGLAEHPFDHGPEH